MDHRNCEEPHRLSIQIAKEKENRLFIPLDKAISLSNIGRYCPALQGYQKDLSNPALVISSLEDQLGRKPFPSKPLLYKSLLAKRGIRLGDKAIAADTKGSEQEITAAKSESNSSTPIYGSSEIEVFFVSGAIGVLKRFVHAGNKIPLPVLEKILEAEYLINQYLDDVALDGEMKEANIRQVTSNLWEVLRRYGFVPEVSLKVNTLLDELFADL